MSTQIIPVAKNNLVSSGGRAAINPLKSRILGEVLKEARTLAVKKYKVLEWELNEPDYQWLCYFAEKWLWTSKYKMGWEVETTMKLIMENEEYCNPEARTKIENGSFTCLNLRSWGLSKEEKKVGLCGEIESDLNFHGLKKLKYISCSFNRITNLDISNNHELRVLFCKYNQLTNLYISNNTKLEKLWCSGNCLTELDISNNTELRELRCNNRFVSLSQVNTFLTSEIDFSNENSLKLLRGDLVVSMIDVYEKTCVLTVSSVTLLKCLKTKRNMDWIINTLENEFGWKLDLTVQKRESETVLFEDNIGCEYTLKVNKEVKILRKENHENEEKEFKQIYRTLMHRFYPDKNPK
jgi:hypothetical protein